MAVKDVVGVAEGDASAANANVESTAASVDPMYSVFPELIAAA